MNAPPLRVLIIREENSGGVTPGIYLRLDELLVWLKSFGKVKTAGILKEQATKGELSMQKVIPDIRKLGDKRKREA